MSCFSVAVCKLPIFWSDWLDILCLDDEPSERAKEKYFQEKTTSILINIRDILETPILLIVYVRSELD